MMEIAISIRAERRGSAAGVVPVVQPIKLFSDWLYGHPHGSLPLIDYYNFFVQHCRANNISTEHVIALQRPWGQLTVVHIRPRDDEYDKTYYASNLLSFKNGIRARFVFYHQYLFEGTIQDFSKLQSESPNYCASRGYMLNDDEGDIGWPQATPPYFR
jgi:hypothetical protein